MSEYTPINEYTLGNIFGITQTVIGYPFDTIKTNLQNSKSVYIYIKYPLKLYAGVKYPLMLSCLSGGLLFGNYDFFYNKTHSRLTAGVLTGFVSACLLTPFDYFKIQRQMALSGHVNNFNARYSYALVKQSYAGLSYTIARELIAIPIYFGVFHYLDTIFNKECNKCCNNPDILSSGIAGGIAGMCSWLFTYPLDTLKTRKQLNPSQTFTQILNAGPLFNGIYITLIRAFIVNGIGFMIYKSLRY